MIRVVLAENHAIVRQGLQALLDKEADIEVVAHAANGRDALAAVEQEKPDVLVLDWMLPLLSGLEVTRRISGQGMKTKVIILSMYADEGYVLEALRHGASAYLLKDSGGIELVNAIRSCLEGGRYLSPPLSERLLTEYQAKVETGKLSPYKTLTDREREVLQLVAEGYNSKAIADQLSISPRTVETHRANLMRKLNLESTSDIIKFASSKGLISSS